MQQMLSRASSRCQRMMAGGHRESFPAFGQTFEEKSQPLAYHFAVHPDTRKTQKELKIVGTTSSLFTYDHEHDIHPTYDSMKQIPGSFRHEAHQIQGDI